MPTEIASAYVSLIPSMRGAEGQIERELNPAMDRVGRASGKRFGGTFSSSLKGIVGGALVGIGAQKLIGDVFSEAREAQKAGALTNQVIKTTGGVANVTAGHVGDLATAISNKIGVDDEAIQSGENLLLTFKNIRNEAGKGNDIFDQATHSLVDLAAGMAAASGGELNFRSSTTLVGKALNDPIKGITALSRVGVTFTQGQKDQIKALVDSGRQMAAQKIILRELKSEFGGAAASQATASDKASVAVKNLEEQIGLALLPAVDDLANFTTTKLVPSISEFVTGMQDGTGAGGETVTVLKDIASVGKGVLDFFNGLPGPVKKYGAELLIAGVALNKVNAAANAFRTSAFIGSISGAGTSLRGLRSDLLLVSAAEGQIGPVTQDVALAQDRLSKRSAVLGAAIRNLAGAGGMLALVDSTHESSLAVVGLERTLGGAATGFAVGGPLGAAVGGTVGLLTTMVQALRATGKEATISIGPLTDYEATLNGVSAAATAATRAMVFERLEKSGLLKATEALGLSDRTAVQAVLGNVGARRKLANAMIATTAITGAQKRALEAETGALGASRLAQLKKNVATAKSGEELRKARKALRDFMAEPASKRVAITGIETATAQLNALRRGLRDALGLTKDLNTPGSGGLDLLLTAPIDGAGATGGIINRPTVLLAGESGREALIPLDQTPGNGPLPDLRAPASSSLSGSHLRLVVGGREFDAYVEDIADSRVDSAAALDGQNERAFG